MEQWNVAFSLLSFSRAVDKMRILLATKPHLRSLLRRGAFADQMSAEFQTLRGWHLLENILYSAGNRILFRFTFNISVRTFYVIPLSMEVPYTPERHCIANMWYIFHYWYYYCCCYCRCFIVAFSTGINDYQTFLPMTQRNVPIQSHHLMYVDLSDFPERWLRWLVVQTLSVIWISRL